MNDKITKQKTASDSVDQIRNILFGEQVTLIENKIANLENKLNQSIQKN